MKTDDLIDALALDARPIRPGELELRLALALAAALVAAGLLAVNLMGYRPDLPTAAGLASFALKSAYTLGLAGAGLWLVSRLGRPGLASGRALAGLAAVLALGAGAAAAEAMAAGPEARMALLMGTTWDECPWLVASLGLVTLPPALWAARRFAPLRPGLAGAAAGLAAGGVAATAYGLHCPESSAVFLAVWYSLGVALVAAVGGLLGRLTLRW